MKCLYVTYLITILFSFIILLTRFISLTVHAKARHEIVIFPNTCSSWVPSTGCCYITMDSCEDEKKILDHNYTIAFDGDILPEKMNEEIETCARDMALAKL